MPPYGGCASAARVAVPVVSPAGSVVVQSQDVCPGAPDVHCQPCGSIATFRPSEYWRSSVKGARSSIPGRHRKGVAERCAIDDLAGTGDRDLGRAAGGGGGPGLTARTARTALGHDHHGRLPAARRQVDRLDRTVRGQHREVSWMPHPRNELWAFVFVGETRRHKGSGGHGTEQDPEHLHDDLQSGHGHRSWYGFYPRRGNRPEKFSHVRNGRSMAGRDRQEPPGGSFDGIGGLGVSCAPTCRWRRCPRRSAISCSTAGRAPANEP